MKLVLAMIFAAVFGVRPLPQEDGPLEPSIQNEVDHAIDRAETWLARQPADSLQSTNDCRRIAITRDVFGTNGLSSTRIALKLISSQRGEGWWQTSTNAAPTRLAVDILKNL